MALRGQGSLQGLRALLHGAKRSAAGAQDAAADLIRSPLPTALLCADCDAGWRRRVMPLEAPVSAALPAAAAAPDAAHIRLCRGSVAASAARPPLFSRWQGSRADVRCHARGFAAAAGGSEPPGPDDGDSSEWLDSSDDEGDEGSNSDEDEDAEAGDDEGGAEAMTKLSADELARLELEDPLACACPARSAALPDAR